MKNKLTTKKASLPRWADGALQSTVFWIGYNLSNINTYHLIEGDLVKEFANQIQSRINNLGLTNREVKYRELSIELRSMGKKRADIVLFKENIPNCIIEVKRAEVKFGEIQKDLVRLVQAKQSLPNVRCFLVIFSQKFRPKEFVSANGNALKKSKVVNDYFASTVRVCKAAKSFKGVDKSNYACLIEIDKVKIETSNAL